MAVSFSIDLDVLSQNVATNSSTVRFKVNATTTQGSYNYNATLSYDIYYDGVFQSRAQTTIRIPQNVTNYTVFTKDVTVTHNSDGGKTVGMAISCDTGTSSGWQSTNKDFSLPKIASASTFTVSGTKQLGSTITFNINKVSSGVTHNFSYTWGTHSSGITNGVTATSYKWNPPVSLAKHVTNATSATCRVTCDTYSGNTKIGSYTQSFSLSIPLSVGPSFTSSFTITDSSGMYDQYGFMVPGVSDIHVSTSAEGEYGSTIDSSSITLGTVTKTGLDCDFGILNYAVAQTLKAVITDSRGRTTTKTTTIPFRSASAPKLDGTRAFRSNSSGVEDSKGTYINVVVKAELPNGGTSSFVIKGKESTQSDSSYTTLTTRSYTGTSASFNYLWSGRSTDKSYDIIVECTDDLNLTVPKKMSVGTEEVVMEFRNDGTGMAIGKLSEGAGLEVGWDSKFIGKVNIGGESTFNNTVTMGDTVKVNGSATFSKNTTFTGTSTFAGISTFNNTVNFNGTVNGLDDIGMKVSVATVYNSANESVPNAGTEAVIELNRIVSAGDNPPTKYDYGLKVPSGCKFVIVAGMVSATSVTGGCNMAASITKNTNTIVAQGFNTSGGSGSLRTTTVTFPPVYISASAGETFRIQARISGSTGVVMTKNCQLTMIAFF